MNLELSAEQASILEEILDGALRELRVEVRRTDTPSYHDELQKRERQVQELLAKLRGKTTA